MICLDMRGRGAVLSIIGKKYGTKDIPTRWLDGRPPRGERGLCVLEVLTARLYRFRIWLKKACLFLLVAAGGRVVCFRPCGVSSVMSHLSRFSVDAPGRAFLAREFQGC